MKRVFFISVLVCVSVGINAQRRGLSRFEKMFTTKADWAMAEKVQAGDVIFNELMPFVTDEKSKFVELFNNSPRYIDLSTLMIANWNDDGTTSKVKRLSDTTLLLAPRQYVVLAPDTDAIGCPSGKNRESLYLKNALPLFSSTTTKLVLMDEDSTVIDKIRYSLKWHSPVIADIHNVSLERIDTNGATQDSMNWHSAASTVGYQTAGWQNSQMLRSDTSSRGERFWLVDGKTFSPNNDGYQDMLKIGYNLPSAGFVVTVRIYTRSGDLVCTPYENWSVPSCGVILYNGQQGSTSIETGLYVMVIEARHESSGEKYTKKLVFVKAG